MSHLQAVPVQKYNRADDLCVITCIFNVDGSKTKIRNFAIFASIFKSSGIPLYVVDCATGSCDWTIAPSGNVLRVRASSLLWQKERLINYALTQIPPRYHKIAWIDADVMFTNPNWICEASALLDKVAVVQLFEGAIRLQRIHEFQVKKDQVIETFAAVIGRNPSAILCGDFGIHGHTGFGWAARREVLDIAGLYDAAIAGGGDHIMAHAFAGDWESSCMKRMMGDNSAWYRHVVAWSESVYPNVRAQIGTVSGIALHLWHGDLESRLHVRRFQPLHKYAFNPLSDLSIDKQGCWQWSSDKHELHHEIYDYLNYRRQESD